jgi:hypothetical protein
MRKLKSTSGIESDLKARHRATLHTNLIMLLLKRSLAAESVSEVHEANLQNILAGRDPQLAVLYTLIVFVLAFMGGERFSLDAKLFNQS